MVVVNSSKKVNIAKATNTAKVLKKRPNIKKTKIRKSIYFRRPKTLKQTRSPKYPERSIPKKNHLDEFKIINRPIETESSIKRIEIDNVLTFLCDARATKTSIKNAIKNIYGVNIVNINTLIRPDGKKKAFVRLAKDNDAVDVAHRIGII